MPTLSGGVLPRPDARSGNLVYRHAAALCIGLSLAAPARAACPHAVDPGLEQTLFTFNAMLYAASSVATHEQYAELQQFLLVYQAHDAADRANPMRRGVVTAVSLWPATLRHRALEFLLANEAAITNYNALVVQLVGPAPSFTPQEQGVIGGPAEQNVFKHRRALAQLLREVWEGGGADLWSRWSGSWSGSQLCANHLTEVRSRVALYLRVAPTALAASSMVIKNPLMPVGSGVTCVYSDGHFIMLIGPTLSTRDEDVLIAHELAHPVFNELFRDVRLRSALEKSACVFETIRRDNQAGVLTRYVYNTWESYFAESLVRTVSHRIVALVDPGTGFTLARFLDSEMQRYEQSQSGFADFSVRTLETLRHDYCFGPPHMSHITSVTHRTVRALR